MAVILNASTSTGFVQSADTSGIVQIQSNGSTVLTVASTGVTATNIQGTIVQGTAVASTSGTSIDFTSIPSWVKRITVIFGSVSTSGTSQVQVQLGDSGGVETTGYTALAGGGATGVVITSSTTGFIIDNSSVTSASSRNGNMIITNINGNTWIYSGNQSDSTSRVLMFGGTKDLSATLDRIRITTVNGTDTFDAGTINIQYEG